MALNLTGKKIWVNGDSITAPVPFGANGGSWVYRMNTLAGGLTADVSTVANGGKSFTDRGSQYSTFVEIPDNSTNIFDWAFINITANDLQRGTTAFQYGEYMAQYLYHMTVVKGWAASKIVFANCFWRPAGDLPTVVAYSPYALPDLNAEIKRVCGLFGVIYADQYGFIADNPSMQSEFQTLHPTELGWDYLADWYVNDLVYTPQSPVVEDPDLLTTARTFTATSNAAISTLNVLSANVETIFEVGNPANSYVPGRATNTLSSLVSGTKYVVVPVTHQVIDLTVTLLPAPDTIPVTASGVTEANAYVTASGRSGIDAPLAALIKNWKENNLWDRCMGLWFLDGSYSEAKFNVRTPLDTNAALRLTQSGGTFSADGWAGDGATALLNSNFNLDNLGNAATFMVKSDSTDTLDGYEAGTNHGGLFITDTIGRTAGKWNYQNGYQEGVTTTASRFYMTGDDLHINVCANDRTVNKWTAITALSGSNGSFVIGNAEGNTNGTTRTIEYAALFAALNEKDQVLLDRSLATYETALSGGSVSTIAPLSLAPLASGAPLPAAYVNAVVAKINEIIEVTGL